MKMVSLVAGLLFSATAFAAPAWNEIAGNGQYFVDAGTINFKQSNSNGLGAYHIRPISVDGYAQVCVAGNRLYAGVVQACTKRVGGNGSKDAKCVATEASALSIALGANTKPICLEEDSRACKVWGTTTFNVSSSVKVKVYRKLAMDKDYPQNPSKGLVGVYTVALPTCGDTPVPAN